MSLPNIYRSEPDVLHTSSDGQKFEVAKFHIKSLSERNIDIKILFSNTHHLPNEEWIFNPITDIMLEHEEHFANET